MATHHRVRTITNVQPCFALSPDGQTLALARRDATLELQDFGSGVVRRRWTTALVPDALAFSPDGGTLAALETERGEVRLWSVDSGEARGKLNASRARLSAMAFSPDGRTLATVGSDHAVRLWDLETLHERRSLLGHEDEVLAVAFAPAGNMLATGGKDNTVRLWSLDALAGKERQLAEARNPVCVARNAEAVLMRSPDGTVRLWDVRAWAIVPIADQERSEVLGFADDGHEFALLRRGSVNQGPRIEFWNRWGHAKGEPVFLKGARDDWSVAAGALAAGVCAVGHDREATLHHAQTGELLQHLRSPRRRLSRLLFSEDGRSLLAFAWPNQLCIWESSTGATRCAWRASEGAIQALAFSHDGALVASGGDDNLISVWDAANGTRVATLRGHKAEIKALAFSPDGRTLASSGADLTLKLWHVPTWRELGTLQRDQLFTFLAFAGEGSTLFACAYHGPLHVLEAKR